MKLSADAVPKVNVPALVQQLRYQRYLAIVETFGADSQLAVYDKYESKKETEDFNENIRLLLLALG